MHNGIQYALLICVSVYFKYNIRTQECLFENIVGILHSAWLIGQRPLRVVMSLKVLQHGSELSNSTEGLFRVLYSEGRILLLLFLLTEIHRHTGTGICGHTYRSGHVSIAHNLCKCLEPSNTGFERRGRKDCKAFNFK